MDSTLKLKEMEKEKEFLLCVDSDGCAVNTMEYKHKQIFGPNMIKIWELESIAEDVTQVWNYVNLYSQWRGINRFLALVKVFELLKDKKTILAKKFELPDFKSLCEWTKKSDKLSNILLEARIEEHSDVFLDKVIIWSKSVNEVISKSKVDCLPFESVHKSLEKAQKYADIAVISSANSQALKKEWNEHGIAAFVKVLAGQEMGSKTSCIGIVKDNKYDNHHVLMVGDSPGDLQAAMDNGVLYYPIIPSKEDMSWQKFYDEAFDKFINGSYNGKYQEQLIYEFNEMLHSKIRWE
ncbi:HAD hydrolase-like protein [Clostridium lacusfryxellense]|uniref:HAD hydrolase-like protein n=1 Tax=Clostridium lacusfryxellense TaxID=205328 RepID=UPI001C0D77AE|nr:HAD hydrolase-like protein [Clostridium lacusfryxellense]MBU3110072.1 HAD hydrolase-like protein [Clostridium lacusfryxellense]